MRHDAVPLDEAGEQVVAEVVEPGVTLVAAVGAASSRCKRLQRLDQDVGAVDEDLGGDRGGLAARPACSRSRSPPGRRPPRSRHGRPRRPAGPRWSRPCSPRPAHDGRRSRRGSRTGRRGRRSSPRRTPGPRSGSGRAAGRARRRCPWAKPSSSVDPVPCWGISSRSPPWVRSRSHGRPFETGSSRVEALELHRQPDVGDPAVGEVGQREVDQLVDPGEGQRRLGAFAGQHVHPAPRAAGLDDGEDPLV